MKSLIKHYPIPFYFIFMILVLLSMRLLNFIINYHHEIDILVNKIVIESILIMLLVLFLAYLNSLNIFKFNWKSFLKGILIGWYAFVLCYLNFPKSFEDLETNVQTLMLIVIANLLVGAFEEILCRGIIFSQLLKKYSPIKAAFISSLIFGLAHLMNLTISDDFLAVFLQVIYAIFVGIFFAAIYYVTKSIWSVIALHGLVDLSSSLSTQEGEPISSLTELLLNHLFILLIMLPTLIIGLLLFKKHSKHK
ncbi:CPBP family intramembrane glutamic endopeptidase [Mammaliicoccus lentus]|uniref:CPBP family intramembrane glutamic endopeptidase n=1 Tax=Mammaliicoccus lentus TaxID=42858 RepID=UPI0026479A62|nr:type II CAAX endopeptidase family protein [Mammaliicoccus lentus]